VKEGALLKRGRWMIYWDGKWKRRKPFKLLGGGGFELALPCIMLTRFQKLYSDNRPNGS